MLGFFSCVLVGIEGLIVIVVCLQPVNVVNQLQTYLSMYGSIHPFIYLTSFVLHDL